VEVAPASDADLAALREKFAIQPGQRIIGMAARLATEKGAEYLTEALPRVLQKHPTARVLYAGEYQNVFGEQQYAQCLAPLIEQLGAHWAFIGSLTPAQQTAFYRLCEVTVLPSINSTESYGLVQVESMACGTPVIASDRPGMRVPVQMTGMGRLVPPADAPSLAEALIDVLDHPQQYHKSPDDLVQRSTRPLWARNMKKYSSWRRMGHERGFRRAARHSIYSPGAGGRAGHAPAGGAA